MKNCWYKIFLKDPSPHCQLFVGLSREWVSLDTSPEAKVQMVHLPASEWKALIQFYQNLYMKGKKVLLRQDYKELVEISLKLPGLQLPASKQFKWKKVGAVLKARFMAWSLCSMKALAFANDLNFSEETKEKLWRFALFQVGIYIPHFLMSSCGSDAAVNDLALHKKLRKFREDDEILAEEALKTLKRHLWYLSELTIPMAFFSDKVDEDIKSRLATKLLSLKKNKKDKVGSQKLSKLKFPKILPNTDLYDLATEEPLEFFSVIKVDSKWLEQPVDSWDNSQW